MAWQSSWRCHRAGSCSLTKPWLLCWEGNLGHRGEVTQEEKPHCMGSLTALWKNSLAYRRNGMSWSFMVKTAICRSSTKSSTNPGSLPGENHGYCGVKVLTTGSFSHSSLLNDAFSEPMAWFPCNPLLPSLTVTHVELFLAIHEAVCPCHCLAKQVSVEIK